MVKMGIPEGLITRGCYGTVTIVIVTRHDALPIRWEDTQVAINVEELRRYHAAPSAIDEQPNLTIIEVPDSRSNGEEVISCRRVT